MLSLKKLQQFAEETATAAGQILVKEQPHVRIVKNKDRQDIATTADIKSEEFILSRIHHAFPDHNVFSEEAGNLDHDSQYTWIIDPLDGTKEYARGLSNYGVLISCQTVKETLAGCVYLPVIHELFSANLKGGAFKNHHQISVSTQSQLDQAFIFTYLPNHKCPEPQFTQYWNTTAQVAKSAYRLRGNASDATSLCWLAQGAIDAYFLLSEDSCWYDLAASLLIAQEAGAQITDAQGKPFKHQDLHHGLAVSNGHLHQQLLETLNQTNPCY